MGLFSNDPIKTLKKQGDTAGLLELASARNADGLQRTKAAEALGELRDHSAVERMLPLLRDVTVRRAIAEALGNIGDPRAAGPLLEAENSPSSSMKDACTKALSAIYAMGPDACKDAVAAWGEELDQGVRRLLSLSLHSVGEWDECPICQVPLEGQTDHVAFCARCDRFFCDPAWAPDVSFTMTSYAELRGESKASLYPVEMVRSLGFEPSAPVGSSLSTFPVPLVYRLKEDRSAHTNTVLATDGVLMRRLAEFLREE